MIHRIGGLCGGLVLSAGPGQAPREGDETKCETTLSYVVPRTKFVEFVGKRLCWVAKRGTQHNREGPDEIDKYWPRHV